MLAGACLRLGVRISQGTAACWPGSKCISLDGRGTRVACQELPDRVRLLLTAKQPEGQETMATAPKTMTATVICSFCGKASEEVNKLIAGPGIYICDGCVQLCNKILEKEGGNSGHAGLPWKDGLTDDDMLRQLGRVAASSAQVDDSLQAWVSTLRGRGVTWARIGTALGMTRQSAWERFAGED